MQYVVMISYGGSGSIDTVRELDQMEGVSKAINIRSKAASPYTILVIVEEEHYPQLAIYLRNLGSRPGKYVKFEAHDVIFDPDTEPALITEVPGFKPKPPALKVATPIITEVPGMPPARDGKVYALVSSQAGLSALGTRFMGAFGGGLNDHEAGLSPM